MLWDIDGTLLRTPGIGVRAFVQAVERVTGVVWTPERLDFGGRTDPDIAARILESAGMTDPLLVPLVLDALVIAYEEIAADLHTAVRVLPGVAATLTQLDDRNAIQTVVTGNLREPAAAKIAAAGLGHHLRLDVGGYGTDHVERAELVRLALARVAAAGAEFRPADVWVVGDTPRDLACARANGVRCALVATGTYRMDELDNIGADLVLNDLSDPLPLLDATGRDVTSIEHG
jgi:phosphoglycolate phosphatase-like HAD superfamily hydrolase